VRERVRARVCVRACVHACVSACVSVLDVVCVCVQLCLHMPTRKESRCVSWRERMCVCVGGGRGSCVRACVLSWISLLHLFACTLPPPKHTRRGKFSTNLSPSGKNPTGTEHDKLS